MARPSCRTARTATGPLREKPKTLVAYSTALAYFVESCHKLNLEDIDRRDLLKFHAFLRDDKEQAPRSCWNKFANVMSFLKANGIRGLVGPRQRTSGSVLSLAILCRPPIPGGIFGGDGVPKRSPKMRPHSSARQSTDMPDSDILKAQPWCSTCVRLAILYCDPSFSFALVIPYSSHPAST
jgi:hypothetical protein